MKTRLPGVGEWYHHRGELLEIVAVDEDDGTIEAQTFDGTLEEFDLEDWHMQRASGALEPAEAPEDASGSLDDEAEREGRGGWDPLGDERRLQAGGYEGLDLFE